MTGLEIRRARADEQETVGNLMELYLHDLTDYWPYDVDATGRFGAPSLPTYWHDQSRCAYVFLVEGVYVGFALVSTDVCLPQNQYWMAQFFVLRRYRRRGIAQAAACRIFDDLPGRWEVGQIPLNTPAQTFWLRVIDQYTRGQFETETFDDERWQGPLQWFDNRPQVAAR